MRRTVMSLMLICSIAGSPMAAGAGPAESAPGRAGHCAYQLVPIARVGIHVRARAQLVGCFDTFAAALRGGSGGTIDAPARLRPSELTETLLEEITRPRLRGSVLIGTEYNATGFGGGSFDYFAPNTCQGNVWEVTNLPAGQNDEFESGKGFGGCDHNKKFAGPWLGGNTVTCTPNCSGYGALNDEVSSLQWRP